MEWNSLKRASDSAIREAKTSRLSGEALERELVALKSAFRSFLKTLWDDLRSRPPNRNAKVVPPQTRVGNAEQGVLGGEGVLRATQDSAASASETPEGFGVVREEGAKRELTGAVGLATGEELGGPFPELTEAEVSDIMQALSFDSSSSALSNAAESSRAAPELEGVAPSALPPGMSATPAASPPVDPRFEGDEAFATRVESALGGQNTSAALADMLRSLRSQGFSRRPGGAVGLGSLLPAQLPSVSSRQPQTSSAIGAAGGWAVDSSENSHPLERWSRDSGTAQLAGDGVGGGTFLSPLEEVLSGSSSDGVARGFGGGLEELLVGDLISS